MKLFRSLSSLALSLLVLMSSSSFMVGIHVCGGSVQDVQLFAHSQGCGMEKKKTPPCHKPAKPCCEDETIVHQGDSFKGSAADVSFAGVIPTVADVAALFISEIIPTVLEVNAKTVYDPPLPPDDLILTHGVFLI